MAPKPIVEHLTNEQLPELRLTDITINNNFNFCPRSVEWIIITNQSAVYNFSIGNLSKDDDDNGSKNVGKKMNFRSFKLNRVYLDLIGPAKYVKCRRLVLELNS